MGRIKLKREDGPTWNGNAKYLKPARYAALKNRRDKKKWGAYYKEWLWSQRMLHTHQKWLIIHKRIKDINRIKKD